MIYFLFSQVHRPRRLPDLHGRRLSPRRVRPGHLPSGHMPRRLRIRRRCGLQYRDQLVFPRWQPPSKWEPAGRHQVLRRKRQQRLCQHRGYHSGFDFTLMMSKTREAACPRSMCDTTTVDINRGYYRDIGHGRFLMRGQCSNARTDQPPYACSCRVTRPLLRARLYRRARPYTSSCDVFPPHCFPGCRHPPVHPAEVRRVNLARPVAMAMINNKTA